jgi:hypothetical protein
MIPAGTICICIKPTHMRLGELCAVTGRRYTGPTQGLSGLPDYVENAYFVDWAGGLPPHPNGSVLREHEMRPIAPPKGDDVTRTDKREPVYA